MKTLYKINFIPTVKVFAIVIVTLITFGASAQSLGIKTNLLYGAYTFTPNLSLEIALGKKHTLDVGAGYNWFDAKKDDPLNKKLKHLLGQIEYRYWFCEKFNGHFIGVHGLGAMYNISAHNLPLLFGEGSDKFRYQGYAYGAGISYGYNFYLGKRWGIELNVGVGYARLQYDRYQCATCGDKIATETKNYFGPTKAGISIVYLIK